MPEIYRVSNVDEAIELAVGFRDEKRYDLFRGQVRSEWLPHTSLMRLQIRDPSAWENEHKPRFIRFYHWLKNTPGLSEFSENRDALFAIAQHYGIPTHYLDFTTDPAVAGFFAADTDDLEIGAESCIFCLDSEDLLDLWDTIRTAINPQEDGDLAEIEVVRIDVANLWRLQAQAGVFLFAPTNWEIHYPMDRIVFPYTGYPSYPTKDDMYPDRKSQLELLLDQFFDNEKKLAGEIYFRKMFEDIRKLNPNATLTEAEDRPLGFLPKYMKSGDIDIHQSWKSSDDWLELVVENHHDVFRREVSINIDFSATPLELSKSFAIGVRRAMERERSLRNHHVSWHINTSSGVDFRSTLGDGFSTLWDGLRSSLYTDQEIAQALGNWLALYKLDFDIQFSSKNQLDISSELYGPSIRIEFGSNDGASSIGFVSRYELKAAIRPDLSNYLADSYRECIDDLEFILQIVTSPQRLFHFRKLATLFAIQIAPTQLTRSPPIFFHPARLKVIGLP